MKKRTIHGLSKTVVRQLLTPQTLQVVKGNITPDEEDIPHNEFFFKLRGLGVSGFGSVNTFQQDFSVFALVIAVLTCSW